MDKTSMRAWVPAAWLVAGWVVMASAAQAADVGVSIGISQPGVYGRIDIGRFPQPVLVVPQPVVVVPRSYRVAPEPVYLWVPPAHQRDWRHFCSRYNACGVPVYFVQDRWYRDQGPGREHFDGRHGRPGERRHDHRREDRRDDWRDEARGPHGQGRH